ncbi:MAG: DUF1566 domain-containing protein [Proteobacteria bacterium]|nr:DUF1566 domain-containing protein [Pseudomonadota bacterium]
MLATIDAPREVIDQCVRDQGRAIKEQNYSIEERLRNWLEEHVVHETQSPRVLPFLETPLSVDAPEAGLPGPDAPLPVIKPCCLRKDSLSVSEVMIEPLVRKHDFFESLYNPTGMFTHYLIDNQDKLTVTDMVTGLVWQRGGSGHVSRRKLFDYVAEMNSKKFAGFDDWRLPTIEEALSILRCGKKPLIFILLNALPESRVYIYTADRRSPGGYWFVDFRQARVYRASGSCFSGGFGRLCRSIHELA